MNREELISSDEYIEEYVNTLLNRTMLPTTRREMKKFIKRLRDELESENAALRQQVKDMGDVIKELKQKII